MTKTVKLGKCTLRICLYSRIHWDFQKLTLLNPLTTSDRNKPKQHMVSWVKGKKVTFFMSMAGLVHSVFGPVNPLHWLYCRRTLINSHASRRISYSRLQTSGSGTNSMFRTCCTWRTGYRPDSQREDALSIKPNLHFIMEIGWSDNVFRITGQNPQAFRRPP